MFDGPTYAFLIGDEYRLVPEQELPPSAIWSGFKANTTAHGIPHVARSKGPVKKVFWTVVSLAALGGLCFNIGLLWTRFFDYGVNTVINIQHQRQLEFPAITVCNHNPIRKSMLSQSQILMDLLNDTTSSSSSGSSSSRKKRSLKQGKQSGQLPQAAQGSQSGQAAQGPQGSQGPQGPQGKSAQQNSPGSQVPQTSQAPPKPQDTTEMHNFPGTQDPQISKAPHSSQDTTTIQNDHGPSVSQAPQIKQNSTGAAGTVAPQGPPVSGQSGPVQSGPVKSGPVQSGPLQSGPVQSGPVQSGPVQSGPLQSGPVKSGPVQSGPLTSGPLPSGPLQSGPIKSGPVQSGPVGSGPMQFGPDGQGPMKSGPGMEGGHGSMTFKFMPHNEVGMPHREKREDFEKKEKVITALANLPASKKMPLGHQIEDFLLDCEYAGYPCISDDFSRFYNNMYGNCYTYNSGWNTSVPVVSSYKPGPQYGLKMTFNIEQNEYIGNLAESAGIRLVVHSPARMPFPDDEGISVGPGTLTSVGIKMVMITRKGGLYGACGDVTVNNLTRNTFEEHYPVNYSTTACYKTCYQRYLIDECGCADPQYPMTGQAFGNVTVAACASDNATQSECQSNVTSRYNKDLLLCSCPMACSERDYTVTVSSVLWPSNARQTSLYRSLETKSTKARRLMKNPGGPSQNLVKLHVYYQEFNYERLYETPNYEAGTFVSDIGGVLGLYIGFSAITILEFGELFIDFLVFCMMRICCRSRGAPNKVNDVAGAADTIMVNHEGMTNYGIQQKGAHDTKHDMQLDTLPPPYRRDANDMTVTDI